MFDAALSLQGHDEAAVRNRNPDANDITAAFEGLSSCSNRYSDSNVESRFIGVFNDLDEFIDEQLEQHGWQSEIRRLSALGGLNEFVHFDRQAFEERLRDVYIVANFKRWVFIFRR
ncbi:hypothetical protein GCM10011399_10300 [Subtercola lobariae]|uniref:Uncharacterized protein n=1 Tax=Subtercola lobariae TaxID=1588641 RepID=A0A917B378_9MICO|nr:hypothetical protein GCM10011399_10300 [Subtercola lobariae]